MKILISLSLSIFCALSIQAQDWTSDLNIAKALAGKTNKEILLVFSGSDWCAPCMKLEKEIWNSMDFQKYAEEHYILVKADFPKKKANRLSKYQQDKNNELAGKYNPNGYFPLVLRLDAKGQIIGKTGYKSLDPAAYIELLESL